MYVPLDNLHVWTFMHILTHTPACTTRQVTLPHRIRTIQDAAFLGCTQLMRAVLPAELLELESMAFFGCISMQSVSLPQNLRRLDRGCFAMCTALQGIAFPDSLMYVDAEQPFEDGVADPEELAPSLGAFNDCTSLKTIVVPFRPSTQTVLRRFRSGSGGSSVRGSRGGSSVRGSGVGSNGRHGGGTRTMAATAPARLDDDNDGGTVERLGLHVGTFINSLTFQGCTAVAAVSAPDTVVFNLGAPYRECRTLANLPYKVWGRAAKLQLRTFFWSQRTHVDCTAPAKECVSAVFFVAARLTAIAWQAEHKKNAQTPRDTAAGTCDCTPRVESTVATAVAATPSQVPPSAPGKTLPDLPPELWLLVLSMLRKSQFGNVQSSTLQSTLQIMKRGRGGYGRSGC